MSAHLRTDAVELDQEFEYVGEVIKSYVDEDTGKRYIVGAATGLEEDHDGERVSKRAIANMVNMVSAGGVKVTAGTHEQNWMTEIGDAVEANVDPQTDQLIVKTELPPEGMDPIADKAWAETHRRKMGWSIGGKLRGAYHELTDTGKKRKVLDMIDLRHLCLTDKPAYQHSFAHAVAKTWDGAAPADDAFVDEDVAKDVTGNWDSKGGGNSGQDSETGGKRNAGTKKPGSKGMNVDDEGKDKPEPEDDDDEQEVEPTDRHMSCPQCGHEFAADIPVDMSPEERAEADQRKEELEDHVPGEDVGSKDGENAEETDDSDADAGAKGQDGEQDKPNDEDDEDKPPKKGKTEKLSQEATMDLTKRVEELEALVAKATGDDKPDPETPAVDAGAEDVAKTETGKEILKVVAVATGDMDERIEKTRKELSEGFEILGKAVMEVREVIGNLPTGRRSVSNAQVLKSRLEGDEEATVEERIEKAESPVEALKILNEATYGIK